MYNRPKDCFILNEAVEQCSNCLKIEKGLAKVAVRKNKNICNPAKLKAPVSVTHPSRLKLTLQHQRLKCSQLEKEIGRMREAISSSSVSVDLQLDQDIKSIM